MRPRTALVSLALLTLLAGPRSGGAQELTLRPPNLSGGWVGAPGALHFNVSHRFWVVRTPQEDQLANSPTMLLAAPIPGDLLVGGQFASNSLVAGGRFNEWELFARWAPLREERYPVGVGLTAAYNRAASSVDGEATATLPLGRFRLLGAARFFSDALGAGESGWFLGGGAVVRIRDGLALSGDLGRLHRENGSDRRVWGAGLQVAIPATPHTLSLHAANTRTGTLQGASRGLRTVWGFEFTIPFTFARHLPWARRPETDPDPGVRAGEVEVTMTETLRFAPETLEIQAGETVVWRNTDAVVHTVTAHPERVPRPEAVQLPAGAEPFDSGNLFPGEVFRHTFEVPGEYRYVCIPHDAMGMVGTVVVRP